LNSEIKYCSDALFELVKKYIHDFELDDRQLLKEEFITLTRSSQLLAFARAKKHEGFYEVCSLGVIENERKKGFGKRIMRQLIETSPRPLYLVSVIPGYFEDLGFSVCEEYPPAMQEKLDYCTLGLPVKEKYVVMKKY
jgi:N-acetylglutamate synthase-like GNAT family acetyltransferase